MLGNFLFGDSYRRQKSLRLATVYAAVFIAIAETASDTFVSYYAMVSGWGDPLVLIEPTNTERAASGQSNLLAIFVILREHPSHFYAARSTLNPSLG
jgi:hypothetical protein